MALETPLLSHWSKHADDHREILGVGREQGTTLSRGGLRRRGRFPRHGEDLGLEAGHFQDGLFLSRWIHDFKAKTAAPPMAVTLGGSGPDLLGEKCVAPQGNKSRAV